MRINQGRIFESSQRHLFSLLLVGAMIFFVIYFNNILGFVLMIVFSCLQILLWTTFRLLEIDVKNQTYSEFTSILGRKFGRTHSYQGVEKIFLDRVSFGPQKTMTEYDAYLKFKNREKIFLVSDVDEKELIERLQPILKKLGTDISK